MADEQENVQFNFKGDASSLKTAAQQTEESLKKVEGAAKNVSTQSVATGVALGNFATKAANEIFKMAKDMLGAFTEVAGQIRQMQRVMGGTAEDISKLRFAAEELGVSTDTVSRSMVIANTHLLRNDDVAKRFGISMRDAAGNVRPWAELLGEMGDRLKGVASNQERATLAREMFGRSGVAMLPLLNQGTDGLKKFGEAAEEAGLVMSSKDLLASKQMNLAIKDLKAQFQGIAVSIGRTFVPVIIAVVDHMKDAVLWFKGLFEEGGRLHGVMKTIGPILGTVAAVIGTVTVAVKLWGVAQKLLNLDLWANPVGLFALAIVGLIGVIIALVKNFEPVGSALVLFGQVMGTAIGWGVNIALKAISGLISGLSSIMDAGLSVAGFFAKLADTIAGFFGFDTGLEDKVAAVKNGLNNVTNIVTGALNDWGDTAAKKGGEVGERLMSELVAKIKALKMPDFKLPDAKGGDDGSGERYPTDDGGGGGTKKNPIEERVKALKEFFKTLVDASRAGLNELRQTAIDARKQMADAAKGVAQSISESFSISQLTESSFAAYNGIGRLTDAFQKRLTNLRGFVANIKKLMAMGLPQAMLLDLVNAGPDQGGAAAALIAANPQSIAEFKTIQAQIDRQSASLGGLVAKAQFGGQVSAAEKAAAAGQKEFAGYLGAAKQSGLYKPTAEDYSALRANVKNEININVTGAKATAQEIAAAVAWALKNASHLPAGAN